MVFWMCRNTWVKLFFWRHRDDFSIALFSSLSEKKYRHRWNLQKYKSFLWYWRRFNEPSFICPWCNFHKFNIFKENIVCKHWKQFDALWSSLGQLNPYSFICKIHLALDSLRAKNIFNFSKISLARGQVALWMLIWSPGPSTLTLHTNKPNSHKRNSQNVQFRR